MGGIIGLTIGGLLAGLLGGPLIILGTGTLVIKIKEHIYSQKLKRAAQDHNEEIRKIKKQYDKEFNKYSKNINKIEKLLAKAKEETA